MTIQGAITELRNLLGADDIPLYYKPAIEKVIETIMDELEREQPDEWCTDCKEYDTEKKCCPRFNKVIRGALKREPSDDGTLEIKVEDATKVGRVLISDDKHRGGLYYPDEDEPKSDLISRAEAIEAVNRAKDEGMINCPTYYLGIVPSADRPRGEWIDCIDRQELIGSIQYLFDGLADSWVEASEKIIEIIREEPTVPQKEYTEQQIRDTFNSGYSCGMHNEWITDEPPVDGQEVIATVYWTDYGDTITAYGHYNARFDTWSLYSDVEGGLNKGFEVIAWMPLPEPLCGADMRGDTK